MLHIIFSLIGACNDAKRVVRIFPTENSSR
jgi:hypothetical protein